MAWRTGSRKYSTCGRTGSEAADRETGGWMTGRQADRETGRQGDRQTGGWMTGRQADRETGVGWVPAA